MLFEHIYLLSPCLYKSDTGIVTDVNRNMLRWHCHPAAFYYLTEDKFKTRYDKFARSCRTAVQDGMFISFLVGYYLLRFSYGHSTKSIKDQCENVQLENLSYLSMFSWNKLRRITGDLLWA